MVLLVGNTALLSDLTLCASKRIVFKKQCNSSKKLLEKIFLALGHFLHIRLNPLVMC
uniref:Uncharacterized protein n=1 Tax=Medicago truncatula TaxID=3880 RepID=B7FHN4_MEDTR|nr:unknown [Medicago truncatula]